MNEHHIRNLLSPEVFKSFFWIRRGRWMTRMVDGQEERMERFAAE